LGKSARLLRKRDVLAHTYTPLSKQLPIPEDS